jgi:outer membrane protein OmpA-like peptidoglycan-associated protein/tetratricopeptide (TPR) repeat protein
MKKYRLHILALLVFQLALIVGTGKAYAQVNRGDFFFKEFEYGLALEAYEFAYNEQKIQNPFLSRKLALTYRMLGDMDESRNWYAKTLHRDKSNPLDMLYYAEALKCNKEYKEAIRWYKMYNNLVPDDRRAIYHLADENYVNALTWDSIYYEVLDLQMNTGNPEFGVTKFKNQYLISYVGVVNPEMGKKYYDKEDVQAMYLDVFLVNRQSNNELIVEDWMDGGINSTYHDGPVCFDPVHNEMIITRNNLRNDKLVLDAKGNVNLKLYASKFVDGIFQEAKELPFNSNDYSSAHPALSTDGNTLYFASNREGGHGETDIYYCTREGDSWSEPQNMGPNINTEGDELFPSVDEDNNLYFSSTGHPGLGALDIFKSRKLNNRWSKPVNMGAPINSPKDDFGLLLDAGGDSGYMSSNRNSATVDDDIFYFHYDPTITIRGNVTDAGNLNAFDNAIVRVYDEDGNLVFETNTDIEGYYDFDISPEKCNYKLEISNGEEYSVESMTIEHCDKRLGLYEMGETLIGQLTYLAVGTVKEKETSQPIKDFRATLYNNETGEEIRRIYTEHDGKVQFNLKAETDYKVSFVKEGWFAKSAEFSTKGMAPGTIHIEKYVSLVFEEIIIEKSIEVENIYYDFNKFFIREDAKAELDKIVQMMLDNPTITIELSSHTDARGDDKFNLALSEMRAKAAVEYIFVMGIEADRIISKGYGEKAIKNRCHNGTKCSDTEHEENRRTEFKVLKF